jgi:outer membrane receptor for ferrienterochelin and colicins
MKRDHQMVLVMRSAIALCACMLAPAVAAAQDETGPEDTPDSEERRASEDAAGEPEDLGDFESLLDEPVVTTASRSAERASSAPATVYTITAEEIRTFGMRSIDEALNYLGIGVYTHRVRDYTTAADTGAQGVLLRDGGRHILVLVDGHTMNAPDTGHVYLHESLGVPLEAIDHLEVMLGAGSVVYGSNAMLAVVNVVTRRTSSTPAVRFVAEVGTMAPTDVEGWPALPGPDDHPGIRYRFGLGAAGEFELRGSAAEVTIHAEWLEEISNTYRVPAFTEIATFDVLPGETTWGGATHHTMQAPSVIASVRVGDFRLQVEANHYTRTMPLVSLFSDQNSLEQRQALRIDLTHTATLDERLTLETRLYTDYTHFAERTDWTHPDWCLPEHIDGCRFVQRGVGRSAGVEQRLVLDWDVDGTVVSTFGYDLRGRDATGRAADSHDRLTGAAPLAMPLPYYHSVSVLGAVFAQQIWQPVDWLELNGGLRLDLDSAYGARISPRVAATVVPTDGTSVRASYSEAFRAPTPYELNEYDGTYRVTATDLQPEIARVFELEWQQRVSWLTFGLRGFASFYEDFIASRAATEEEFAAASQRGELSPAAELENILRYDNLAGLRSFGGSLSLRARPIEGLTLAGSVSIADTQAGGHRMPIAPVWLGNARVSYEFEPSGPTLALAAMFAGSRIGWTDVYDYGRLELGEQLDLRATFSTPISPVPGLSMRVSFGYVTNARVPVLLDAPTEDEPDPNVTWYPVPSSFDGFLGLQYDVDP